MPAAKQSIPAATAPLPTGGVIVDMSVPASPTVPRSAPAASPTISAVPSSASTSTLTGTAATPAPVSTATISAATTIPASPALPDGPPQTVETNIVLPPTLPEPRVTSPAPDVSAASAILVDAVSGQVLYAQSADTPRPMASTTKIMTALLFCERVPDDALITASKYASETRESSLHLKPNEKLTAHDLLRAILMRSANDGCVAAAEHVAGSEAAFVALMNARAAQLGATHTHFMNPHGLHNKAHYTTARDLATIARTAIREPRINEVVKMEHTYIARSMDKFDVGMRNHSHFLGHFPGADGIKTGYTVPAGHCYVGSATQNDWRLITVVLKSKDYVKDTAALMQWGFQNFEPRPLVKAGASIGTCDIRNGSAGSVSVVAQRPVQVVLKKGAGASITQRVTLSPLKAPVDAGASVGVIEESMNGKVVSVSPLIAASAVPKNPPPAPILGTRGSSRPLVVVAAIALILALYKVSFSYGNKKDGSKQAGNTQDRSKAAASQKDSTHKAGSQQAGNGSAAPAKGARRRRRRVT